MALAGSSSVAAPVRVFALYVITSGRLSTESGRREKARGARKGPISKESIRRGGEGLARTCRANGGSQARISFSPLWRVERCDYDVLAEGFVVGRIMKVTTSPAGTPWMWTLAYGDHEDRTPTRGYEATREAAMAAFAKSWWRE